MGRGARPFDQTCVRADRSCAIDAWLPIDSRQEGRASDRDDALVLCPVSALRLSADPDLPWARRPSHGPGASSSPLEIRRIAAAATQAPASRGHRPSSSLAAASAKPCLGLRLHLRRQCERAADQVPHGGRRIHPGVPRDRRGRQHPAMSSIVSSWTSRAPIPCGRPRKR